MNETAISKKDVQNFCKELRDAYSNGNLEIIKPLLQDERLPISISTHGRIFLGGFIEACIRRNTAHSATKTVELLKPIFEKIKGLSGTEQEVEQISEILKQKEGACLNERLNKYEKTLPKVSESEANFQQKLQSFLKDERFLLCLSVNDTHRLDRVFYVAGLYQEENIAHLEVILKHLRQLTDENITENVERFRKSLISNAYSRYKEDTNNLDRIITFLDPETKEEILAQIALSDLIEGNPKDRGGIGHNNKGLVHIYPLITNTELRRELLVTMTDRYPYNLTADATTYWDDIEKDREAFKKCLKIAISPQGCHSKVRQEFLQRTTETDLSNEALIEAIAAAITSARIELMIELLTFANERNPQLINQLTRQGQSLLTLAASAQAENSTVLQMCNILLANNCQQLGNTKGQTVGDLLRQRDLGNSDALRAIDMLLETRLKLGQQELLTANFLRQVAGKGLSTVTLLPIMQNLLGAPAPMQEEQAPSSE